MSSSTEDAMPILLSWRDGNMPVRFMLSTNFRMTARGIVSVFPDTDEHQLVFGLEDADLRFSLELADVRLEVSRDPTGAREVTIEVSGARFNFTEAGRPF